MNFQQDLEEKLADETLKEVYLCEGWKFEIGRHIAAIRKSQGLSQKDVAKQLGISQAAIAKFESGINLTCDSLWKIGYILKTDIILFGATAEKEREQFKNLEGTSIYKNMKY